ncbi:response regulator transcription factor [Candidatus Contubernalis alkalaceticus]|uniref:response regulator transcription factor n=1 Tax=Candidatus Contubernalis alkaliaceticus TaxID=338645 RepID=UPI0029624E1A|nr:response regulator transcription factor [Candidatus Contubernalis alkalaceticus]
MVNGRKIKVLVVDDHPVVVQGITSLLVGEPQINVVGVGMNGAECLSLTEDANPDVVLLDINLPDGCGIDLIEKLKEIKPQVKIIIITGQDPSPYVNISMKKKADHFLVKDCHNYEIISAIFIVLGKEPPYHKEINNSNNLLTAREKEIMNMVAMSLHNKEIARQFKDCHQNS